MIKNYTAIAAFLGAIAIILGALGAHALKSILTIDELNSFETAVRYQIYHVIILLIVNIYPNLKNKSKKHINLLFLIGILFFSGSIYAITLLKVPAKLIWFVTPLGGVLFIWGWIKLGMAFLTQKRTQ